MRTLAILPSGLALFSVIVILGSGCDQGSTGGAESIASGGILQTQFGTAAGAREADPEWKPQYPQIATLAVRKHLKSGALNNFCVNTNGDILACCGSQGDKAENKILVFSPDGNLTKTLALPINPGAVCVDEEGMIFVGGSGRILKLDQTGQVLAEADSPVAKALVSLGRDMQAQTQSESQKASYLKMLEGRKGSITGMAVTKTDLFIACPAPNDFSYSVYRLDRNLANARLVTEKLRGCCGQMDIQAMDDKLWIAHNARHRVECRDREGKEIASFGSQGRVKAQEFGGCCEPKNLRFTSSGEILAAESGPPTCIKKFSKDGKFLGVVGLVSSSGNCVRVTVDVSPDGKQYYLLDTAENSIRVFGDKS